MILQLSESKSRGESVEFATRVPVTATLSASTDWRLTATVDGPGPGQTFPASGSVSGSEDLWDGVIGIRGRVRLGESAWAVPGYLDVGTGSSDLTWQGVVGLLYAFDRIDVAGFYRHLAYDSDGGALAKELSFSGVALGAAFRFGGG